MEQLLIKLDNVKRQSTNACQDFFISEYIDGPNKNKVIEIYNPTDSVKSLNGYSIKIFNNGAPTPLDIPLSGNVNPKETYVVTHPQADPQILAKADQTDVKMNFDGNDAIVLNKGQSTYIDKIGEIGVNPGQGGWNVPPNGSTKEKDLRRKFPIDKGETDWMQGKNQWDVLPKDSTANIKQHQNICSSIVAVNDLIFSFDNIIETGTNPRYFEFDIMVEANNSNTYFDNCLLRIAYNTSAFGSNVVANNKVTITKGAAYNSVTYIDPNTNAIDQTASVMGVPFGTDFNQTSWNRTLVTTTPTPILHFKMEIASCNQNSGISFTDTSFTPIFSFYTVNANDNITNTLSYDNTFYLNNLNQLLCELKITNFTSPVYPGTWYQGTTTSEYLLTIQGNGFGAARGNGNVYFLSADDGGQNYFPLDGYDFLSWTDNEIKIRMPSIIDTLTPPGEFTTPGSGVFYVKTDAGDSVLSNAPIDMPYAIKNAGFATGIKKVRMDLMNVDNSDSVAITFRLDTSITNNPMVEAIVRKAVKEWRCNTLVYFETGTDTTLASAADGISVIHFTNSLPSGVLALTSIYPNSVIQCLDNNGNKHVFPKEMDIAFLRNPAQPWYFDTLGALPSSMRDFYEIALHEVGHANLLQHVNAPTTTGNDTELMFWTGLVGPVSEPNRRYIDFQAANGGFDVVQISNSLNINLSSCYATNIGTLFLSPDQSCGTIIGFEELLSNDVEFNLYPNPTNGGFTVIYELNRNATVEINLYDYTGKLLKRIDKKVKVKGQHSQYIETQNLTSGLYFIVANIDGKLQTMKLIKQ